MAHYCFKMRQRATPQSSNKRRSLLHKCAANWEAVLSFSPWKEKVRD